MLKVEFVGKDEVENTPRDIKGIYHTFDEEACYYQAQLSAQPNTTNI